MGCCMKMRKSQARSVIDSHVDELPAGGAQSLGPDAELTGTVTVDPMPGAADADPQL